MGGVTIPTPPAGAVAEPGARRTGANPQHSGDARARTAQSHAHCLCLPELLSLSLSPLVAHTATRPSSQGPASALRLNYFTGKNRKPPHAERVERCLRAGPPRGYNKYAFFFGRNVFLKSKVNICFYFRGYVFGRAGRGRRANFLLEFQFYSCADGRVECDLGRQRALPVPLPHEPLTHTTRWWLRRQRRRPGAHCRGWHSFRGRTRRCRRRRHQGGFGRLPVLRSRRRICRRRLRRRRRIARGWGLCASGSDGAASARGRQLCKTSATAARRNADVFGV